MNKLENHKYLALLEEFTTSYKLITLGLGELQNINLGNDFYFLPFQLLSQGIERFLKAYICVGHFELNKALPSFKYLKGLSHDLELLLEDVTKKYFLDYQRIQYTEDYRFITTNSDLKELLSILSEFGKVARYHNFDLITDSNKTSINATKEWQDFELKIINEKKIPLTKLTGFETQYEVYHEITQHIIIVFEKFLAGLGRQFIYNNLGQTGKQLTANTFFEFGMMYDKDYGQIDYRKNTLKFKETPLKVHKRNLLDKINRAFNPNLKSKKLLKKDYNDEWPFYAEEVVVECRYKHWCVVSIAQYDYALNGAAKGRYKLENPHDAGMAILGRGIGNFIKIALELQALT